MAQVLDKRKPKSVLLRDLDPEAHERWRRASVLHGVTLQQFIEDLILRTVEVEATVRIKDPKTGAALTA